MNILTPWLRSYLPELPVDDRQLAEDLTLRGIAVEGEFPLASGTRYEMDITTNRVDAMNHYGVAREAAAIYGVPLKPLDTGLEWGVAHSSTVSSSMSEGKGYPVRIEAPDLCGRFTVRVIRGVTVQAVHRHHRGVLRCARPEAYLRPRRRYQLRMAGHGPTHALL